MKTLCASLAVSVALMAPVTATAQAESGPVPEAEERTPLLDLVERLLRRFMADVEPQLREFERGIAGLEPEMQRLLGELRDMTQYHPPEVLPNGDIVIRRRQSDMPEAAPEADPPSDAVPFEL